MRDGAAERVSLWVMAAVIAAVQIGHLLVYRADVLVSPDSVSYIAVARSLAAGDGMLVQDGSPLIFWPPLYPILLSGFLQLGIGPLAAAALLNSFTLALIALTAGLWLQRRTGSLLLGALGTAVILVSKPLWYIHVFVWTEPLFALLSLWSLLVLQSYLKRGGRRILLAAAALAAVASLVRYPGVFVIGAGGLALLASRGRGWPRKLGDSVLYASIAVAPLSLWWWWSVGRTADPGGQRVAADRSLLQAPWDLLATLANWALPWSVSTLPKLALLAAIAILLILLLAGRGPRKHPPRACSLARAEALGWFVLVYGLGVLALASVLAFDLLRDRILAPLYAPLALWLLLRGWNRFSLLPAGRSRRLAGVVVMVLLGLWIGRSAVVTSRMVDYEHRHTPDFSKSRWKVSETLRHLVRHPPEGLVFSNAPHAVYLYTRRHTLESPRKHYFDSRRTRTEDLARFEEVLEREGGVRLVWLDEPPDDYHYQLEELERRFEIELLSEFADGSIYRVRLKAPRPGRAPER